MIVATSREGSVDIAIGQCLIDFTNGTIHDVMHVLKSLKNKKQIEGSLKKFLTYQATSYFILLFRLATKRRQDRGEKRNPRQIRRVLSRDDKDQHVPKCVAPISPSSPRAEDRGEESYANRKEEHLCHAFQKLSLYDVDDSNSSPTLPHQPRRRSLGSIASSATENRRNDCSGPNHRLL